MIVPDVSFSMMLNPVFSFSRVLVFMIVLAHVEVQAQAWKKLPPTKIASEIEEQVETHDDIIFARNGEREMLLNLYRPKDRQGKLPAIICIHGGGWAKGNRQHHAHVAKALAARGYVTVSIDYRLSGEAIFPAHIEDCKAAVRWMRANAATWGVDPDWIGATGSSAGGHLAVLLATSGGVEVLEGEGGHAKFSSVIQAAAPMGGQSDFLSERNRLKSAEARIWQDFLGGTQDEVRDTYRLASPRAHLNAGDPPVFFMSGELDDLSTHGVEFREDCLTLGIPTKLHVISGAPHGFLMKQKFFDEGVDQLDTFFSLYLKRNAVPDRGAR